MRSDTIVCLAGERDLYSWRVDAWDLESGEGGVEVVVCFSDGWVWGGAVYFFGCGGWGEERGIKSRIVRGLAAEEGGERGLGRRRWWDKLN